MGGVDWPACTCGRDDPLNHAARLRGHVTFLILPKAVTTTDTDEFSVKSADYSVNNDLPSSSPSGKTVLMIPYGLVGFFVFVVLAVEFRSV